MKRGSVPEALVFVTALLAIVFLIVIGVIVAAEVLT